MTWNKDRTSAAPLLNASGPVGSEDQTRGQMCRTRPPSPRVSPLNYIYRTFIDRFRPE